jgi:hypothetical protein
MEENRRWKNSEVGMRMRKKPEGIEHGNKLFKNKSSKLHALCPMPQAPCSLLFPLRAMRFALCAMHFLSAFRIHTSDFKLGKDF